MTEKREVGYYSSYKSLFRIKWKIYSIGDKYLPRPIPLDALGVFLLLFVPSLLVAAPFANLFGANKAMLALVLDAAFTGVSLNFDPQGRSFLVFIFDMMTFFLRPKQRNFTGASVPKRRKLSPVWEILDFSELGGGE
jgi:hypothetical protein